MFADDHGGSAPLFLMVEPSQFARREHGLSCFTPWWCGVYFLLRICIKALTSKF